MHRYFFNIRDDWTVILDPDGDELPDLDAVRSEAIRSARDILGEAVAEGRSLDHYTFVITDESGAEVLVVPFKAAA